MLLQNLIPIAVESALPFASNNGNKELLCEWVPAKAWKSCSEQGEFHQDGLNPLMNGNSYAITESNGMCKRRKLQKMSLVVSPLEQKADGLTIDTVKGGPLKANVEYGIDDGAGDRACVSPVERCIEAIGSNYKSLDKEYSESLSSNPDRKESTVTSPTTRTEAISAVERPVSKWLLSGEDLPIRDICISVLRSHGLLVGDQTVNSSVPTKVPGINECSKIFLSCKLCGNLDHTSCMLLCDHCEDAFHVSCCHPKTKVLPTDEWFCQPCSKSIDKASLEAPFLKSQNINWWKGITNFKLDPIASMLKYPELYTSRVRIGDSFQAAVPEWSDQFSGYSDCIGEPLEMDPAETIGLHGFLTDKYMRSNSISNWLQCQEVICDGTRKFVDGIICGKWRRAPLSDVQTDDWDCSCSVLWDPSHSDCAVPQELETNEVLLQLKYIEQLRSRLAAKKSEFHC
ncbi:hypothetical protein JCGZ_07002 [Jatropha curcas]|uniref:PHD-type domain-containing protein n=1 Tax=Jatropha curcas TaxID=180498 RepID=A0A067KB29_JATCU|nr:uncharacterized protein LOC105637459 isoform X2 [Jatropha curcas]KDP33431.1 hypothetical protein JCGZ_07002 [Jatropha curcas]